MSAPFKFVVKARGSEGVFHILISATVVVIAVSFAVVPAIYSAPLPVPLNALLVVLAAVGLWFLVHAVVEVLKNREWEMCVDEDRLTWISRDRVAEKIEGEIRLRDIRALIYRSGDEAAYMEVELVDGSVKRLPLVGVPSEPALLAFINYWREAHAEIPIRNLENA
jgi:hypothetical protein